MAPTSRARALLYVVAYDIPGDRRRARVHDLLLDFGLPVQYSVFECRLTRPELDRLRRRLRALIRPRSDSLRIYRLCAACDARSELVAGPPARTVHTLLV